MGDFPFLLVAPPPPWSCWSCFALCLSQEGKPARRRKAKATSAPKRSKKEEEKGNGKKRKSVRKGVHLLHLVHLSHGLFNLINTNTRSNKDFRSIFSTGGRAKEPDKKSDNMSGNPPTTNVPVPAEANATAAASAASPACPPRPPSSSASPQPPPPAATATASSAAAAAAAALRSSPHPLRVSPSDPLRDLFEACKAGDAIRVRELVTAANVNARDTAGRRSSPLHFAAGKVDRQRSLALLY